MEANMTTPDQSSDPDIISRSFSMEGNARMLEHQNKTAEIRGFTIKCAEREPMGDNSAPSPLAYIASSILF